MTHRASTELTGQTIPQRLATSFERGTSPFSLTLLFPEVPPLEFSYADLLVEASHWLQCYDVLGLARGARVAILLPHSVDLYAAFLAAIASGRVPAILSPPSPKFSTSDFEAMFLGIWQHLDAAAIVTDSTLRATIPRQADRLVVASEDLSRDTTPNIRFDFSVAPDDVAFIQYSSGTTGLKKGVQISHRALMWQVDRYASAIDIGPADRIASWLPLYHDMGLIACWLLPLLYEIPILAMSPHDWIGRPASFLKALTADRSTLCWLPNFAFSVLERAAADCDSSTIDLSCLRGVFNCSEPVRHETVQRFVHRLEPLGLRATAAGACYAMAETTFAVTTTRADAGIPTTAVSMRALASGGRVEPGPDVLCSSGSVLPGIAVDICDDEGAALPDGRVGEIRVSAPCQFQGYLCNPVETERRLRGGYLFTGDIGFQSNGELFVLGRADDLLIIAGQNIQPQDVEASIDRVAGIIPGRCVAVGIDDEGLGTARLVVIAESRDASPERRKTLVGQIREAVVRACGVAVGDVHIVEPGWLKKSTSGKVSRKANRERYLAESKSRRRDVDLSGADIRSKVRACVAEALDKPPSGDAESLILSGRLDSIGLAILLVALEQRFDVRLPMPQDVGFAHFDSVEEIITLLERIRDGSMVRRVSAMASTRQIKVKLYEGTHRDHDLVILGSSRAMGIDTTLASARTLSAFNFAVDSARVEDWCCIHSFVLDRCTRIPSHVLIGIEPEAFWPRAEVDARLIECKPLFSHLKNYIHSLTGEEAGFSVQEAVRHRLKLLRSGEWLGGEISFRAGTGDLLYCTEQGLSQRPPARPLDLESAKRDRYLMFRDFDKMGLVRETIFRELAANLRRNGSKLICYFTPIHPELDRFLSQETPYRRLMSDIADLIRSIDETPIPLYDFRTPAAFGGAADDFADPTHTGPDNQRLIFERILASIAGK